MSTTETHQPDLVAVKSRQRQTWASGDYAAVASRIVLMAERLADAADLRAGERAAAEGLSVDFAEGDAEALQFPDGAFDAVLSCVGVMFTPDQERAAAELVRCAGPAAPSRWPTGPVQPRRTLVPDRDRLRPGTGGGPAAGAVGDRGAAAGAARAGGVPPGGRPAASRSLRTAVASASSPVPARLITKPTMRRSWVYSAPAGRMSRWVTPAMSTMRPPSASRSIAPGRSRWPEVSTYRSIPAGASAASRPPRSGSR
jgi:hypothetical protein